MQKISPKYLMDLEIQIKEKLFELYRTYDNVEQYLFKWHELRWEDINGRDENFAIIYFNNEKINVVRTIANIDGETKLKIAIDLGIETPDFIPCIPTFRNTIKSEYVNAHAAFEKAFNDIEEHPDIAIGLANSALESIIKEIMKDELVDINTSDGDTLYDLTIKILKEFKLFPGSQMPDEINQIGSSLLKANQGIEKLRSSKTKFHGGTSDDYLVDEPMYAYFVLNSIITVGLFLDRFYKTKQKRASEEKIENRNSEDYDDLPF